MSLEVDIKKNLGDFHLRVNFCSNQGIMGLLGASGCGKSITLKCIAGIERPDSGRIILNDRVLFDSEKGINLPPQKRRVGYLFQNYALFPNMTVEQNIAAGVRDRHSRRGAAKRLMDSFQLEECRGHFPRQLSGGQQQRVALARILASEPEALLLDEPFSALDSTLSRRVELELMERLEQFSGPVVFVTHDRGEVRRLCRNVCVVDHGSSQPVQPVEQLFSAPETLSACRLSGCENISAIRLLSDGRLEASDWGVTLCMSGTWTGHHTHVGVRAAALCPAEGPGENCFLFRVQRAVPDLSGTVLVLMAEGGTHPLYMNLNHTRWQSMGQPERLWVQIPACALLPLSS
jgi:molybdate transport system ATP-binding protein